MPRSFGWSYARGFEGVEEEPERWLACFEPAIPVPCGPAIAGGLAVAH